MWHQRGGSSHTPATHGLTLKKAVTTTFNKPCFFTNSHHLHVTALTSMVLIDLNDIESLVLNDHCQTKPCQQGLD